MKERTKKNKRRKNKKHGKRDLAPSIPFKVCPEYFKAQNRSAVDTRKEKTQGQKRAVIFFWS